MRKVAILGADIFEDQRELTLFKATDIEASYYICKDPLDLVDKLKDVDGLIVNLEKVTPELISHLDNVKVIGRYGVGVDNIDLKAATEKKVAVINVPDYCVDEVAEHAVSFIFAVNRKLFTSADLTKQGVWGKVKDLKPIYPIKDITLGVVGTGRIGMKVIQTMVPFGTRIVVFDPYIKQENLPEGVELVGFDELLEISDIVTIHCPLTEQTRHLFNSSSFAKMKRKPALINVSRGPIINETDLLAALDNGNVSFAALDVMETEPPAVDHPLLHHPKAVVTNHIAWYSIQAEVKLRDLLVSRVIDYLNGNSVPSIVNKF
jgi:D-3-phosphoglycerate dehydrogenase